MGLHLYDYLLIREIRHVAIWGKGNIADVLIRDFETKISIDVIIETQPQSDYFHDIKIVDMNHIPQNVDTIIVIPSYDFDVIANKLKSIGIYNLIKIENLVTGNIWRLWV